MSTETKIKILLCDDSAILRRLTKQALSGDKRMEVIDEAANGREALNLLAKNIPDVVVLDVEMPVMDGVDTLREIRRKHRDLPVIMFSSVTQGRASEATVDALAAGANDFVTKPSSVGSLQNALQQVGKDLCEKILTFVAKSKTTTSVKNNLRNPVNDRLLKSAKIEVVGIGSSTGGPAALATVIEHLPASISVPVLITQHMPASFIGPLANRLSQVSGHKVRPAVAGEPLVPGEILIAPGDRHLCLLQRSGQVQTVLDEGPPVNSCRPAVDCMFQSIATCFGRRSLGVVLTGMGKDGRDGALAIKREGGVVFAQDESSSVVYGMPREVVQAGAADKVVPILDMGVEISRLVSQSNKSGLLQSAQVSR